MRNAPADAGGVLVAEAGLLELGKIAGYPRGASLLTDVYRGGIEAMPYNYDLTKALVMGHAILVAAAWEER